MSIQSEPVAGDARESAALTKVEECLRKVSLVALSDARFLQSHDCFEAASTQRAQIAAWFADRSYRRPPLDIVSLGSGGGDLDLSVVKSLRKTHGTRRYTGVDPNSVECDRCRNLMQTVGPGFEALVLDTSFEDAVLPQAAHDLVFAVQTLYYLGDVPTALARAVDLLRPQGELVVFQAPRGKLNRLSAVSWELLLQRTIDFSEDLVPLLEPFDSHTSKIEAWLDVTPCLGDGPEADAVALRDFILQIDSSRLDAECVAAIDEYLKVIGRHDDEGRWWVPHPVDAHVICRAS